MIFVSRTYSIACFTPLIYPLVTTRLGQGKDLEGADKLDQLVNTIPKPQRPRSAAVVSTSKGGRDKKDNMFLDVRSGH